MKDERKLLVAEMSWLRGILGKSRRERIRNEIIWEKMEGKETIVNRIRKGRLTWFRHVTRMENGRLPIMALHSQVDGRRDRGRPTKTWMDNIIEDLKVQGMDIREEMDKAIERSTWRLLVGASSSANV